MKSKVLLDYTELLNKFAGRKHLLLGNGFSIACDKRFSYQNLFEFACEHGLSSRAQALFGRLGTNNFEGVLRALKDSIWICRKYGVSDKSIIREMKADLQTIKVALVAAVAETHLEHANSVSEERKRRCVEFLTPYHNVFTANYDLLLYWVAMYGQRQLQEQDGFRAPLHDKDAEYLTFREHVGDNRGIFFLHGALHLYIVEGEVRKHCWIRSGKRLTKLIREGFAAGQYPLFVAEGTAARKREQIQRSGYLSYCLGKLERLQNVLFVYGLSFAENDRHIANTIADNPKLTQLCVGLYGDWDTSSNQAIRIACDLIVKRRREWVKQSRFPELSLHYFDSQSACVWE